MTNLHQKQNAEINPESKNFILFLKNDDNIMIVGDSFVRKATIPPTQVIIIRPESKRE